ncbi:hypothetical protein AB6A40_011197 [Gnathostoma spinigerum]|uniref:Uncharacterized protein n=1 Tax=Gnathostoma spinigerum TaxID=75299 RepID=A0ABD6EWZ5_9BILA
MLDGSDLPVFGVGDPQTSGSGHLSPQGTQWKELHSSRKPSRHFFTGDLHFPLISFGHRHSPKLQSTEIDKNSCDASSEESDDCTVSHRDACVMTNSLTDSQVNSLKRRHKSRCTARERNLMTSSLHKSSLSTFEQNVSPTFIQAVAVRSCEFISFG